MAALRVTHALRRENAPTLGQIQQRLAVFVLGQHVLALDQEAVAGIRRQQVQALVLGHQHRVKAGTGRRAETPGQRLALPARGGQGVG